MYLVEIMTMFEFVFGTIVEIKTKYVLVFGTMVHTL